MNLSSDARKDHILGPESEKPTGGQMNTSRQDVLDADITAITLLISITLLGTTRISIINVTAAVIATAIRAAKRSSS